MRSGEINVIKAFGKQAAKTFAEQFNKAWENDRAEFGFDVERLLTFTKRLY